MHHQEDDKLDRLYRLARDVQTDTSLLEDHFEARLMARIRERRSEQAEWLSWTWRFARAFSILAVFLGIITLTLDSYRSQDTFTSLINNQEQQIMISCLAGD